jgi:two-component system, chemotaxis family, sensor kinase CheA
MAPSAATSLSVLQGRDVSILNDNGSKTSPAISETPFHSTFSTLADLPGHSTILGAETTGEQLGKLFLEQPDLPGVILLDERGLVGVISQTHFYKCVSRAFGREIYYRRPATIMLSEVTVPTLMLTSENSIQTAVENCLMRPQEFVYEPFLVYDQEAGQYRLCSFQILVLASSQLAALRNRQMELILDSVTDGLLVIDKDFRIGSEYSRVVEKVFERADLRDASFPEVLRPLLDSITHGQIQDYLKILFDPKLIDRLIKSINPAKQISVRFPSMDNRRAERIKHFTLNFERIRTQADISQVLVQIEDITQQINLAKELAQQEAASEEKLHLVMQILQVDPVALNRFITHFNEGLSALEQLSGLPAVEENLREVINEMFRKIHTLKGEASLLRLGMHERLLHQLEDGLDKLRSAPKLEANNLAHLIPSLEALQQLSDQIRQLLEQVKSLDTTTKTHTETAPAPGTSSRVGLMESLSRLVSEIGERIDKPAVFYTSARESDWPAEYAELMGDILPHLVRNSMVHGIEPAALRAERGKNLLGAIQFEWRSHPDYCEIIFQDDGDGLNVDKIRRRVEQLGWHLPADYDLRHAIFEPGFSTAESITDLAGRGVGLDAVRNSLQKVGGRIIPHSQAGAYCAFQILLPSISPSPSP